MPNQALSKEATNMERIPKYRIPVRIALVQDESVLGVVFVRQEQRILDMLCEPKPFFPVNTKTGTLLVNKQSVIKLEVLDEDYVAEHRDNFPEEEEDETYGFRSHAEISRRRAQHMPV
jgi:hypothetical protein